MTVLRVWAPAARRVTVEMAGAQHEMERAAQGWWHAGGQVAAEGTEYRFGVDGGPPRPDPRSPHQPGGVHGPSRTVDHAAFPWTDAGWAGLDLSGTVLYELHVGTFSPEGTFAGAAARLDHLAGLGVTAVELLPVVEFPGDRGWGYDGVDLFAPHHAYGGPDGLKHLVDSCHRRGLAVVLDVVYNHLGPDGNYLGEFGPYFTDRYRTPWGQAVNLDGPGSDGVREFIVANALMWLRDYHLDGLRLDAVHAIVDQSALHLLEELARVVTADLPGKVLIAESDLNDPRLVAPWAEGGYGLDAAWSDDFHHALHAVLTGERDGYYADFGSLAQLAKALTRGYVNDGGYSPFRGRRHGRALPSGVPGCRLVGYLQNHDQIGNRALGERSSHLLSLDRQKVGAALVLTAPFVPMVFQGEEWGATSPFQYFTDHRDQDLADAVRRGRQEEFAAFGWEPDQVPDPQAVETFARSQLDWSEVSRGPHADLLDWHKQLLALRASEPDLSARHPLGAATADFDEEAGWLVLRRGRVTVAANLGAAEASLAVPDGEVALASMTGIGVTGDRLTLPPDSVAVHLEAGA